MQDYKEKVVETQKILEEVLSKYFNDLTVDITNFYKAIRVTDKYWTLNFWIRIHELRGKLVVDFSTVEIPKENRRKGIFTAVINELKKCEYIGEIRVTSALTIEMRNCCVKNGFKALNELDWVYNRENIE